jgi:non-heme chloroperoxidase
MVKTPANPGGLPKDVFDGFQTQVANNRAQFYRDVPAGPFYGFNRPGAKVSEGIIQIDWQGHGCGAAADCCALSRTDLTQLLCGLLDRWAPGHDCCAALPH